MSEVNSIKVNISNRSYPLRVTKEEEEKVMLAVQAINTKLKEFEDSYAVKDKQDLLAMCALQFATAANNNNKQTKKEVTSNDHEVTEQIDSLKFLIDDYLATETSTV